MISVCNEELDLRSRTGTLRIGLPIMASGDVIRASADVNMLTRRRLVVVDTVNSFGYETWS